jgi:hypothetical protein
VTTVAVVAVLVTAAALAVVGAMLPRRPHATAPREAPRRMGLVDQTLIESDDHARLQRDEQRRSLDELGWADRAQGLARIPIGRAMDLVVQQESTR